MEYLGKARINPELVAEPHPSFIPIQPTISTSFALLHELIAMAVDPTGPLSGLCVLDASRVLAGPFCGQLLGDLGARVIKIERPGTGDETRAWGPPFLGELSAYFLSCNRHKESVTLDLARAEGVDIFEKLVRKADIVLENFRAASADKLGLAPSRLLQIQPRLIICSISGYGRTGPWHDMPGYDFAIQALSGLMHITGPPEGPPSKVGVAVTDVLTGLYAAVSVLACVHARQQSGHGYHIDLSLLDCAAAAQVNLMQSYLTSGTVPARQGNAHLQIVPYQLFQTLDGWLVLAVGNDQQWQRFCRAAGHDDLALDARYLKNTQRVQSRLELVPIVAKILRERSTEAWQECLTQVDVPHAPVWDYATLLAHPQAAERGMRVTVTDPAGNPVDLIGSPFHISGADLPSPRMPPRLGQDTEQVLAEVLQLSPSDIAGLRQKGIV